MPSKISEIYDRIVTVATAELSGYKQIPNPYFPEQNSQLLLKKGFGIGVGAGQRVELEVCKRAWSRVFNIVLVNQVTTTDHGIAQRSEIEKNLLEDHFNIWGELETNLTLNSNDYIIKADVVGDTGLQFLVGDQGKYLSIAIDVEVLYQEDFP